MIKIPQKKHIFVISTFQVSHDCQEHRLFYEFISSLYDFGSYRNGCSLVISVIDYISTQCVPHLCDTFKSPSENRSS